MATPEELNSELYAFFENLPISVTQTIPDDYPAENISQTSQMLINSMLRRQRNEFTGVLAKRLVDLLKQAPVTFVFFAYTYETIYDELVVGTEKMAYQSTTYWVADIGKSPVGIFDKERAKEMEREAYKVHDEYARIIKEEGEEKAILYWHARRSKYENPIPRLHFCDSLDLWKQQFLENYGEEL